MLDKILGGRKAGMEVELPAGLSDIALERVRAIQRRTFGEPLAGDEPPESPVAREAMEPPVATPAAPTAAQTTTASAAPTATPPVTPTVTPTATATVTPAAKPAAAKPVPPAPAAAPVPESPPPPAPDADKEAAILRGIHAAEKERPLSAAHVAGKEVMNGLLKMLKDDKGVHAETAFYILGALAGYACQASVRAQHAATGATTPPPFNVVASGGGRRYFLGDALNAPLAESKFSVWSLAAGAAQQAGCDPLPEITEMFAAAARALGSERFGKPKVPDDHKPGVTIEQSLEKVWPAFQPLVEKICLDPAHWPIAYGLAIQELFRSTQGVLVPDIALRLVMDAAIASSKMDLAALK